MTRANKDHIFSQETVSSLVELYEVMQAICNRLIKEGKAKVVDGKVIFLEKPSHENRVVTNKGEEITL